MPCSRLLLGPLLIMTACKTPAPAAPAAPAPAAAAPTAPAAPMFDGLFRAGASWRFAVKHERTMWDDTDPDADANGNVTTTSTSELACRVTAVRTFASGRASEIECDDDADWRVRERVAGVWIQTAAGLWHDSALPDEGELPELALDARVLPAEPKADRRETIEPESDDGPAGGSGSSTEVEQTDDGWCVTESYWGGDESWQRICFDDDGPSAGGTGFSGGSTDDVTFERISG